MKKAISLFLLASILTFFSSKQAFADTIVTQLIPGGQNYATTPNQNYLGYWGAKWTAIGNVTSTKGAGSSVMYFNFYYTDQISSWGEPVQSDIVNRGATTLVDSYNNKSYSYDTFCTILYNGQKITINKTLGWSSSKNPYVTYPLTPGICYGSAVLNVNHVFVNY